MDLKQTDALKWKKIDLFSFIHLFFVSQYLPDTCLRTDLEAISNKNNGKKTAQKIG